MGEEEEKNLSAAGKRERRKLPNKPKQTYLNFQVKDLEAAF